MFEKEDKLEKKEKYILENKSIFRKKDLKFMNKINNFVNQNNLNYSLKIKGVRDYKEIDLEIKKEENIKEFSRAIKNLEAISQENNNLVVEDDSKEIEEYLCLESEAKFYRIKDPEKNTKTIVNLMFVY